EDMFFIIPIQPEDMDCFAFTWESNTLSLDFPKAKNTPPTLAHHALAQELEKIPKLDTIAIYQYIDDILVGGEEIEVVGEHQQKIISHLESLNLQIPPEKIQKPSQEMKLLGIWWKGGMTCIPPDTLTLGQIKMPESRKDLQQTLGLLVFWRKHIPDFSIIARPLYDLLRKGVKWNWTPCQEEALQLLVFEATAHQALGPIHPTDP
ncbi:TF26 protein, partial [Prunella himalayana]|nr:TF26 protein [Prunella himalayana]